MTPTPEPGQRVWIAAVVVPSTAGHPMLTPITADGQPSAIRLAPTRYRWQPVPPQPPVLDEGMAVRVADDPSPWKIHTIAVKEELGWWSATVRLKPDLGATRARRATAAAAPLADVPGPDDSTPEPPRCDGCDGAGVIQTADGWENCDHCVTEDEPQPAGEGAALIAATEQEIAERFSEEPRPLSRAAYAAKSAAWEATACRLARDLDELVQAIGVIRPWLVRHGYPAGDTQHLPQQAVDALEEQRGELEAARGAPVQAATHGEAGEAQEGAQAAPRVANSSTGANGSLPAVQGAGRDWRGELSRLIALEFANAERLGLTKPGPNFMAERLVAALGLHDLEQAAAEATRLRRVNDEWGLTMSTLIDGLAERGVPVKLGHRYTQAALDALDSARRELEQLRGEVARVADWFERMADTIGEGPYTDRYLRYAKRVRAALAAAAAPATQDGDPK